VDTHVLVEVHRCGMQACPLGEDMAQDSTLLPQPSQAGTKGFEVVVHSFSLPSVMFCRFIPEPKASAEELKRNVIAPLIL
jgi:hypothetical protein